LKYSVASFITRLSWNNDNKAMIYQTVSEDIASCDISCGVELFSSLT